MGHVTQTMHFSGMVWYYKANTWNSLPVYKICWL